MTSKIENCFLKVIETLQISCFAWISAIYWGVFFFLFLEDAINY